MRIYLDFASKQVIGDGLIRNSAETESVFPD